MSDTMRARTWFNRAWLDFTGRTMEQELGNGWADDVHPDDLERCLQIHTASFDARQPFEMDYRLRRRDGAWRWMLDRGTPTSDAGGFTGYMGGCVDIHDRKEAEHASAERLREEQAARAEAERVALLKDEFLATVSHEMRTPLTAILGWSQLLRKGMLDGANVSQAVETIERNARTQAQLIEDLLDMSRILSGRMRLDVKRVRLPDIIAAALEAAKPAASAKRIGITRSIAPDSTPVAGDPIRLQQVVWNLLNNAVKFTPEGGRVTITLTDTSSHAELAIADTGEGIPADFLPHVFDRFRQANAGSARRHGGLGLGLAIVKQLVELHGGTVVAESEGPGLGARFTIRLPLAVPEAPEVATTAPARDGRPDSPARNASRPTLKGADILVVDDDRDTREILRTVLEQTGATVRTAASAAEAYAAVQASTPTVLVSDIGMPGEDGYSLIRKVRALPACSRTPAIALTAFSRTEDRHRALLAGFQMHLSKPVEATELVVLVSSLLRR
jgi:PAS domain S-box-containing protein